MQSYLRISKLLLKLASIKISFPWKEGNSSPVRCLHLRLECATSVDTVFFPITPTGMDICTDVRTDIWLDVYICHLPGEQNLLEHIYMNTNVLATMLQTYKLAFSYPFEVFSFFFVTIFLCRCFLF